MLQLPGLALSVMMASIYALAFHLWLGRGLRDLLLYWLAAVVGFASGHVVGQVWGFVPWTVGQVHLIEATLVAFLFLLIARLLRQERKDHGSSNEQ